MIRANRKSKNYNNNLIDPILTFEPESNWTVTTGIGSATRSSLQSFYGTYSLRIVNTAPASALVVNNTVQNYAINQNADYGFAFRVFKELPLEVLSGKLNIYSNGALLGAEAWSVGDADVDLDEDGYWVTFVSSATYSLTKGDDITFTIEIDPNATGDSSIDTYVDGIQMYRIDRGETAPPQYTPPINNNEIFVAEIALSNPLVKAINTTPQTIISSPGSGLGILVVSCYAKLDFNTTAFDLVDADGLRLGYASSDKAQVKLDKDTFVNAAATARITGELISEGNNIMPDTALEVFADDDPANGDGTISIIVYYRVVKV